MKRFVPVLVLLLLVLVGCSSEQPSGPRIAFSSDVLKCSEGSVVNVSVLGFDLDDVSAFQFSLVADREGLTFKSFEEGSFLKSVRDTFVVNPKVDGLTVGPVAVAQLGGGGKRGSGSSGSGVLGVFVFECSSPGKVVLSFDNVKFVNPPGELLSVGSGDALVVKVS